MFGCVYLPNFVCQACLRLRPELHGEPVAIVEGAPPLTRVVALNAKARKAGIFAGMTRTEAESYAGMVVCERQPDLEISAHAALLDCVWRFSPRIEGIALDTVVLDLYGLHRLMGTLEEIGKQIREHSRSVSLYARVGIASSPDVARFAARSTRSLRIIPTGQEAEALKPLSVTLLDLDPAIATILHRWGIRTFGQLAALPSKSLVARLGQDGLWLQRLAQGESARIFAPTELPQRFVELVELDDPVHDMESLGFVIRVMLDQLCQRLVHRALATAELRMELQLDLLSNGATATNIPYSRFIRIPIPTTDAMLLLKLVQLDLAAHPPGAPVAKLRLEAEPMRPRHVQEGMFTPQGPEPQQLEVTLARLRRLVGEDRVGSPEVIERHSAETFRLVHFTPDAKAIRKSRIAPKKSALRIYRPHRIAHIQSHEGAPVSVWFENRRYRVQSAAGPWRRSGEWWSPRRWGRDEWDLVLMQRDQTALIVKAYRNLLNGEWFIEGEYD